MAAPPRVVVAGDAPWPSAEALVQEVIGELAAMTDVSAVALYEPGAAVAFRTRVRWKSRNCAHFEPFGNAE